MGGGNVGSAFAATLKQIGTALTSEDLVKLYPPRPAEVKGTDENVPIVLENCKFYDMFDADPAEINKEMDRMREEAQEIHGAEYVERVKSSDVHHPLKKNRTFDYRLNPAEKSKLVDSGFVASQCMSAESFAEIYYRLYTDDMPVFITADSILHAWHRSFDTFLAETEVKVLFPALEKALVSTLVKCHGVAAAASNCDASVLQALLDVELFLRVALSLLRGTLEWGGIRANTAKLRALLAAVEAGVTESVDVFSSTREIDFSQFKPRGHYTKSEELTRYFRAMIWVGTVDFRIAGGSDPTEDLHQLQCAVLLVHLLQESGNLDAVEGIDWAIESLVADGGLGADSLSPRQLARFVNSGNSGALKSIIASLSGSASFNDHQHSKLLVELQQQIVERGLGAQLISAHPRDEDLFSEPTTPTVPHTSFTLLGQRFVWSSFIFSRLVFDQVIHEDAKQKRRIPSAVDVAFTLFGNDVASAELAARMEAGDTNSRAPAEAVAFRDGIPFASNLVALRQVIDQEFNDEDSKGVSIADTEASVSMIWLQALRALSRPSPNDARTFHSDGWKLRLMNTQIASFTQLRHDSLLYVKQSYTMRGGCEYADGMVEPYPLFWE
ncbi:hypothetical protein BBJ28_00025554 [Nothophytophthora sp. Chile5]|nr:hypothetical protein BBJ28_00025554 [Nothophytophthora sp. Chile5]